MNNLKTEVKRSLKSAVRFTSLCSVLAMSASLAFAEPIEKSNFNIEKQSVTQALNKFAEQAGIQMLFSFDEAKGINANALSGSYSTEAALAALLKGTGLEFKITTSGSYVVRESEPSIQSEKAEQEEAVEEVVVTGTLLRNVNPVSPMITLTARDFERMGVHSAEDIVRSLPQNHASLNVSSSMTDTILSSGKEGGVSDLQGNAAANLRGLGIQNTLVLVNGRRTAGSPIFEGNFVNLSNVPFAAIERVEILLDGASSIYGADAVGGVINFIMKKGWTGSETAIRMEDSIHGGNAYSLSQVFGTNWGSGDLTVALSYKENKPVSSEKAGWLTVNQSDDDGTDFRLGSFGSPGIISGNWGSSLPSTFDGTENWSSADLSNRNIRLDAGVPEHLSPMRKNTAFNMIVNQDLTEEVSAFVDLQYAKNNTDSSRIYMTSYSEIKAGHPLNRLGRDTEVGYQFIHEVDSGLIPRETNDTNQIQKSFTGGLEFKLLHDWQLKTSASWSESSSNSQLLSLTAKSGVLEDRIAFAEFMGGVRMMENLDYDPDSWGSKRFIPMAADGTPAETAADQIALPADQVYNPFGNGTAQSQRLSDFVRLTSNGSPISTVTSFKAIADGTLVELSGGSLRAAFGVEYRLDELDYTDNSDRTISSPFFDDTAGDTDEPERSVKSLFTDFSIPLVGADNALPFINSFELQASLRWDEYRVKANRMTPGAEGTLNEATFAHTSPKIGFAWRPVEDLKIRGTWTEVFRAPDYSEILQANNIMENYQVFDQWATNPDTGELMQVDTYMTEYYHSNAESFRAEYDPETWEQLSPDFPESVGPSSFIGGNPDLDPETGELITLGFDWTPAFANGLTIAATYTRSELENQIATIGGEFFPAASTLLNGDVYKRESLAGYSVYRFVSDGIDPDDPYGVNGTYVRVGPADHAITLVQNIPVNTGGFTSESVDFNIQYLFDTEWAAWDAALYGTYTKTSERKPLPVSPSINKVGLINGIDSWVGAARLGFVRNNYGATVQVNYSSSYLNTRTNVLFASSNDNYREKVEHYSTIDLTGHYTLEDSGWRFLFGARNVLNQHYPVLNNMGRQYDSSRIDVRGRIIYLEAKKTFNF